jgi:hypothetical protein
MSWIQQGLVCFHNKLKHMFCKLNNYHDYVTLTSTKWKINIIELCMYGNTFIYEIWIKNILIKIIWTIVFFPKLEKLLMQLVIVVCLYMFHISWQHFSTKDEIVPITVVIAILTLILIKKTHSIPHGEQFKIGINNSFWITMKCFYSPKHNPCIVKIGKIYHKFLIWNKKGRNSSLCMMPLKQTQFQSFENLVSYFFMAGFLEVYVVFLYAFMIQAKIGVLLNAI